MPHMETANWLSPGQAARLLGLSVQRVGQLIAAGKLPATATPLGRLLDVRDVQALAAERAARKGGARAG